jgi:hypothetical protein
VIEVPAHQTLQHAQRRFDDPVDPVGYPLAPDVFPQTFWAFRLAGNVTVELLLGFGLRITLPASKDGRVKHSFPRSTTGTD